MLEFRILGPLEVCCDGTPLELPGLASRQVLALLVLRPGSWVAADRMIDELWADRSPDAARKALQVRISRLRRTSGSLASVLASGAPGYRLDVAPAQVDAVRFERLVEEAGAALAATQPERARERLLDALGLWRGPPLAELSLQGSAAAAAARLGELRLVALEHRIDADLQLGRHAEVIAELQQLVSEQALRERLHEQLMLALYRAARQAEALDAFRAARRVLVEELGIEPGPALQRLQASILRHDPALDLPERARSRQAAAPRLPLPRTPTVGREGEIPHLRELLGDAHLVTLVGTGGIGKTRLAVELARAAVPDFSDGAHFISLAATESADLVATELAGALGVAPLPDEPALDAVVRFAGDRQMLLVLDNFEHVLAAVDVVATVVERCERLRVLVTSRERLGLSGEQLFPVRPLALPEQRDLASIRGAPSVSLFVDRCRARDTGFALDEANAGSVAEICARVEGIPLAIELAAAHSTLLAPKELNERLDDALSVLTGGPRDAPARQQTLRATLDWSYALLEENEKWAFAGLAVFSGGCTLEAAESVTGIALTTVEALLAKSLLMTAGPDARVRMLEPVRAYAAERLDERPAAEDLRRRHCEYYVDLAERSESALRGPEQMIWIRRLDAEHANLRAALRWSVRAQQPELGLRLAAARGIHPRGFHTEIREWLETRLQAAPDAEPHLRAKACLALGTMIVGGPESTELLLEALRIFRAESDPHRAAQALVSLSIGADQDGDRARAADLARQALELARTTGDEWLIAIALGAQVLGSPESFRDARRFGEDGLAMLRRQGDRIQLSAALGNFGFAAMAAGDYATAAPLLDEAVAVTEEVDDKRLMPFCLVNRGLLHALRGDDRAAARDLARTLRLCRDSGEPLPVAEALTGLAAGAARRTDIDLAARLTGAADAQRLFQALGVPELLLQEQVSDPARADRDDADWQRGWTAGNALTFEQALALGIDAGSV